MSRHLARLSLYSLAVAIATPAFAQSEAPPQSDESGLGVIVVTAQKREENIQDVPIAISAVGEQYLESRGVTSLDALSTVAPNVKIERAPSSKTISQIAIRGSVTINPAITWEPAVGLYVDGVYISKAQGSLFDIADLERVEILRGPQGTLYGRNSLAGAVNLITRKPSGEAGGRAEITYGSYDYVRARASLDLPAVGPIAAKVSGQITKRDGLVKTIPNPFPAAFLAGPNSVSDIDTIDSKAFMVQLRGDFGNLTVDYTYDYNKITQRPPFAQLLRVNQNGDLRDIFDPGSPSYAFGGAFFPIDLYANPERQTTASIDGAIYERSRAYGHALTLTLDLGAAELKSITAYRNMNWADGLDLDGSPLPVAFTQRISDYDAFSQELQLTGAAMDDRLKYVLGAFYFDEKAETLGPQSFFGGGADYQSDYGSNTKAWALYAQVDFDLTDALMLTLGGRYTHERKDIRRFLRINFDAANGITSPLVVADIPYGGVPDAKYNNFSPAATLSYKITPDVNVYARFARGFKSGGFNGETNEFGAPTAACPTGAFELCDPYRPEKVDSYEVGLKSVMMDGALVLNLAAFHDKHKDIQLSIFRATGAAASVIRNAASARIQGLEVESVFRPVEGLTLNGSLAFLDAKYNRYIDGGVDVADNRAFPHTPKFSATLGFDWQVTQGSWGKLNLYGDLNHVSKYFTFPYPLTVPTPSDQNAYNTQSPGRTIINLRLAVSEIELGGATLELAGFVRNLTKERDPSNFIDFGPGFGGLTLGYFPDPRTWGVTLGARF
ncbi:MAG: TonB-dependent receptor [Sphingomonadaceae bacterium]|nr:TonB-dependent receptor [Sphingomonadaceae bacterium]